MMKKQNFWPIAVLLLISSWSLVSAADDFDGSKPLICAAIFSAECSAGEQECTTGAPWMINFPVFMEIDFKAKQVTSTRQQEAPRTSAIRHVGKLDSGQTAIQGTDINFAWSMLIAGDTGSMTLGIVGQDGGFLVFGACQPRK